MNPNKAKILEVQIQASQAFVVYWNAMISSGAYKTRKTKIGQEFTKEGGITFRPMTETELLENTLGILHNHVDRVQSLTDALVEELAKNRV